MDDIFTQCREGNAVAVRLWLDNTENDLNQGWVTILFFVQFVNGKKMKVQVNGTVMISHNFLIIFFQDAGILVL